MPAKSKPARASYSDAEKTEIVCRFDKGETMAALARIYNVPESTLRSWGKKHKRALENEKLTGQSPMSLDSSPGYPSNSSGDSPNSDEYEGHTKKRKRSDVDISSEDQDYSSKWMTKISSSMADQGGAVYVQPTSTTPDDDSAMPHYNVTQSGGGVVATNFSKFQIPITVSPLMTAFSAVNFSPVFKFLDSPISSKIDDCRSSGLKLDSLSPIHTYSPDVKLEPSSPVNTYSTDFNFKPLSSLDDSYTEKDEEALDLSKPSRNIQKDEALEYGEKFLEWLEESGDPRVTQLNTLQVRNIIDKITEEN